MTTTTKNDIVDALEQYLSKHKMSANGFVKISGINESYISSMRNRSFVVGNSAIDKKWFEKAADTIGYKLKKEYWKLVMTNQTTAMLAILEDAKEQGDINVIIGETGCGKTYTANLFAEINPEELFVIKVSSSDNLSDVIDKILDKAKLPMAKSKSKKIDSIIKHFQKLNFSGKKPMLIFDECEYMKQPTLCLMKELCDGLKKYCALILIGTDELTDNIERLGKRKTPGIRQFNRRLKLRVRVLPSIDNTFKQFLNDIQDTELKSFLQKLCDNYGELHDALVPAMREAERVGEPLTENFVRKVLNIPKMIFNR